MKQGSTVASSLKFGPVQPRSDHLFGVDQMEGVRISNCDVYEPRAWGVLSHLPVD